jgi:thiol-disulfide isomerase/thioredoxin
MRLSTLVTALAFSAILAVPAAVLADGNHTKGPEPVQVLGGQQVQLSDYLVPGKTTIFDFHSEYCPPCRAIAPKMQKLHETHPEIAVVDIDINRPDIKHIDWASPVAQQYGLQSIPNFKIFGPDGKLIAEGDEAYEQVEKLVE